MNNAQRLEVIIKKLITATEAKTITWIYDKDQGTATAPYKGYSIHIGYSGAIKIQWRDGSGEVYTNETHILPKLGKVEVTSFCIQASPAMGPTLSNPGHPLLLVGLGKEGQPKRLRGRLGSDGYEKAADSLLPLLEQLLAAAAMNGRRIQEAFEDLAKA